jgi:hypothetical protein
MGAGAKLTDPAGAASGQHGQEAADAWQACRASWILGCGQLVSGVIAPVAVSVIPAEVSWATIGR